MKSKKKLIISLTTFMVIFVAAVVAIVSVLAATNATVKSGMTITYKADPQVKAEMYLCHTYNVNDLAEADVGFMSPTLGDTIIFNENSEAEQTMTLNSIELNSSRGYVIIAFLLRNTNSSETNCYANLKITDVEGAEYFNISIAKGDYPAVDNSYYYHYDEDDFYYNIKSSIEALEFYDPITDFSNTIATICDDYDVGATDPESGWGLEEYSVCLMKIEMINYETFESDVELSFNFSWEISHVK